MSDLRYALRSLRKAPGFTAVAVLTLALGIGATTAIFSVVHAVLLQPLPYADPDRLVRVHETFPPSGGLGSVSMPNLDDWREQNSAFSSLAAHEWRSLTLEGVGEPERLVAVAATGNVFHVLGAQPRIGRALLPGEDRSSTARAVVLSDSLWRARFGADPGVLGRSVVLIFARSGSRSTVDGCSPIVTTQARRRWCS